MGERGEEGAVRYKINVVHTFFCVDMFIQNVLEPLLC